jgi:hypothetical protein
MVSEIWMGIKKKKVIMVRIYVKFQKIISEEEGLKTGIPEKMIFI